MSRENPFDWSRDELAAYNAHESVRNGAELGTVLKNLGRYDQGVVDAACARGTPVESPKVPKPKARAKRTPRYLIELCGMGDHTYAIVGPAGWAWIHAPVAGGLFPREKTGVSEKIPPEVLREAEIKSDKPRKVGVTIGSCDNDRAIHCSSLYPSFDARPKGRFASTYVGMLY
jgi:hypothetical protein